MQNYEWYSQLNRPELSPPKWVFPPVWTTLYILIFISLCVFIKNNSGHRILPLIIFGIQMALNFSWSPVFFGMKNIKGALIICILMWIFIFLNIIFFYQTSKLAGILLIPYFLWVTFAMYLNFEFLK